MFTLHDFLVSDEDENRNKCDSSSTVDRLEVVFFYTSWETPIQYFLHSLGFLYPSLHSQCWSFHRWPKNLSQISSSAFSDLPLL